MDARHITMANIARHILRSLGLVIGAGLLVIALSSPVEDSPPGANALYFSHP
ncbi:MAG TPA: hypothetical protein PLR49_05800 [Deltaproteobacteria bacterium]|nr:hypothetical protein [Deltaproteobacteria bacterium]